MFQKNICCILLGLFAITTSGYAQKGRRIDTTMKYISAGYRIYTNNKSAEKNSVTISLIGFTTTAQRDASFEVKGVVTGAAVDDFNNDGFPDMVVFVFSGKNATKGTVIGIASEKNESVRPIFFPDILDDAKIRTGYKGQDTFQLIEGTLMRSFPVFDASDTSSILKPLNIIRHIQYNVTNSENGALQFKVLRTYDTKL